MQIVIDIDENVFTRLFDNGIEDYTIANDDLFAVAKAIRKGTPLPKGHKRLIEDNFEVGPIFDEEGNRVSYRYITQYDLDNAKTIIEADEEDK